VQEENFRFIYSKWQYSVKTIALVSCVNKKKTEQSPARNLYISPLFQKASAYAEAISDEWFILSAEYRLIEPNQKIEPYNQTLNKMRVLERKQWADEVFTDLKRVLAPKDEAVIFAGKKYREFLVSPLISLGVKVEIPMEGMRIGEQLRWLNHQLDIKGKL
jgi:hypothetical protein